MLNLSESVFTHVVQIGRKLMSCCLINTMISGNILDKAACFTVDVEQEVSRESCSLAHGQCKVLCMY